MMNIKRIKMIKDFIGQSFKHNELIKSEERYIKYYI
jgi:hypothetical protein